MAIYDHRIERLLKKLDSGIQLTQQENYDLEFKSTFDNDDLKKLYRHFAGFANSGGGYIIFGIKDKPIELIGMSDSEIEQFRYVDHANISNALQDLFSRRIDYNLEVFAVESGKKVGILYIHPAKTRPIVALNNGVQFSNGEICYRYDGKTSKIRYVELEDIIQERADQAVQKQINEFHKSSMNYMIDKLEEFNLLKFERR